MHDSVEWVKTGDLQYQSPCLLIAFLMNCGGPGQGPNATPAMVARPRELLRELREGKDTVKALKAIKNQVIGNKFKKNAFVNEGAVEQVLEVLRNSKKSVLPAEQADVVQQQAAIILGSLSLSESGLARLLSHEGLPVLVTMLHSGDEAVVEAGLWAVKMALQQSTSVPSYLMSMSDGSDGAAALADASARGPATTATTTATALAATPVRLDAAAMAAVVRCLPAAPSFPPDGALATDGVAAAGGPEGHGACGSCGRAAAAAAGRGPRGAAIAALAAAVVACSCRREEERALAIAAGAPEGLLSLLLLGSQRPDTQVAALEGLSLMLPRQPSACVQALARPEIFGRLMALRRDPTPSVRLLAASCVATLSRVPGCEQSEAMQRAALPVLLRLLAQPDTRPHVPDVLARLIEGSEPLQKAAADADTVRLLAGLLASEAAGLPSAAAVPASAASPSAAAAATSSCAGGTVSGTGVALAAGQGGASSRLREGCLRALGSLCLNRDDSRKQLLEAKVLRHIVRALEDPADGVREAAALCVRALSRCVRTLRGGLLEGGGELAPLLVGLLQDANKDVQASAAAAVCNLVLDFSSAKSAVLAAGGLGRLVALTASDQLPLRCHATWALANLLYRAEYGLRVQLMQALPWCRVRALLSDSDPEVVEQALVILRNLCMGDRHHIAAALEWGGCGPALQQSAAAAAGAATAAVAGAAPGLRASHAGHSQGQGGGQQQQQMAGNVSTSGGAAQEGLLDVLQALIVGAAASGSASEAAAAELRTASDQHEDVSTPGLAASPSPSPSPSPMEAEPSVSAQPEVPSSSSAAAPSAPQAVAQTTHALYTLVNLLTGGRAVKDLVAFRRPLLAAVVAHLRPAAGDLALPAVWCVVNLTWRAPAGSSSSSSSSPPPPPSSGAGAGAGAAAEAEAPEALAARCRALMELDAGRLLEELSRSHPSRDVQERARTALEQLRGGAGAAGAATAGAAPAT